MSDSNNLQCADCEQSPCQCAEWERQLRQAEAEDAERLAEYAETLLPYLWSEGSGGLLARKRGS